MSRKSNLMTEGVIWKQLVLFSIPLLIGNLFQQLYNTVDSIIVGNFVGSQVLAAVGASTPIINLLVGFFMGIATGAGIIFSPYILRLMGAPADVFDDSVLYLRIYFLGSLFLLLYNMGAGVLRAIGDSKRPLYYLCLSSVINIILDVVFVVGFKMGVAGVALATLIAQAVSAILLMIQLIRSKESYSVHLKAMKVDKFILREIIIVGIPTGLQQVIISLSNAIVQSSINSFGSDAIAGCSAYLKLDGFMILPIMSFSMAATTFTGQNLGAKQYGRIYKGMRTSLSITTIYTVLACLLMYFFGAETLRIFTQDENVLHYGRVMLDTIVPAYLSLALMQSLVGTVRGAGKTMIMSILSLCVVRVCWIFLVLTFNSSIEGVFLGYPISWIVGFILMAIYTWKCNWLPIKNA